VKLTVKFYSHLRGILGENWIQVVELKDNAKVYDLLKLLFLKAEIREVMFDENETVKSDIAILKNGREIKLLKGIDTELSHGDEISVFPQVAGG
jgi:molybdopterin synthase sulfur carrier subunit